MLRSRLKPRVAASIRYASSTVRNAFAVVIGGGVAGGSTAFHLTRRNIKDVILVESRDIASPQATSFHSPGLVSSSHPAHRYKPILAYSVDLYSRIGQETGVEVEFSKSGTLRLATNNTRLDEFRRYAARDYYQQGDVCKTTLISKEEVKKLAPILDDSSILGALRTEGDGSINARQLTKALVKGAVDQGATLLAGVRPVGIKWEAEHSQWRIHLSDGSEILTRNVVNAAGSFANDVARLSGHTLPISIVEHQYAVLTPSSPPPPSLPSIVDHDSTFYVRQAGEQLLFGGFEAQDRVVFREDWYRKGVESGGSASVQPDFARLDVAWQRAQELIPSLKNAKIEARAASFSMTSDGYPLVGPYDKNYWLSTGFLDGVSSGGGIGKYLADWMVDGEPPQELFDTDANRFDRWTNRQYILTKSRESYSMYYNWSYLNRLAGRPTDRISGIYGKLKKEKARFSFRNGWEVPLAFELEDEEDELACLVREYQMVTNRCGLIDLSWKGKLELKGPDSIALLDYALANKVPRLGEITSAFMLTRQGRVLSPLKVFHHDNVRSQFILLTEPERESRDMYWLIRAAAEKGFDVQVSSVSEYLASLALVGPLSRDILSLLTKSDVSDAGLPMRTTRLLRLGLVAVVCARSSTSTGQLSYELFHNRADTLKLYEAIMRVGADHGIVNFGQRTMNSMRLEHGYKIWGRELTLDTNPFEVGLGHLVDFDKKDFIGRSSAFELKDKTFDRRLTLLQLDANRVEWKNIPQGMEVVRKKGEEKRIGQITSGSFSVRLQKPLAFAWVDKDVTPNDVLTIDLGTGDTPTEGRILEQIPSTPID